MPRLKSNLVDDILSEIVKKVNDYTYLAGDVVSEVSLAEELSVSRTPVREAILRLIEFGVLERTATKVVVKSITLSDIAEILEVREAIEGMSAKLIIKNGGLNHAQIAELEKINKAIYDSITAGNYDENFTQDNLFHDTIISFGRNTRLLDIRKRLTIQAQRSRRITIVTPARHIETAKEHENIIKGFKENDYQEVKQAIVSHISNSLNNYTQILSDDHWINIISELKGQK